MNHCTTPQTAFLLKEAGFPQPTPEFGQAWANESIHRFIIDSKFGEGRYNVHFPVVTGSRVVSIDPCAYCPTICDLLRDLHEWNVSYEPSKDSWFAHGYEEDSIFKYNNNQNPADILAGLIWQGILFWGGFYTV